MAELKRQLAQEQKEEKKEEKRNDSHFSSNSSPGLFKPENTKETGAGSPQPGLHPQ